MSEYQYYEYLTVDRPLSVDDRAELHALCDRARISANSFAHAYELGGVTGDSVMLMRRWFDLHLHVSGWGTRRLMLRLPKHAIDYRYCASLVQDVDCAAVHEAGDNLILEIVREAEDDHRPNDGKGWLERLAPLRTDLLAGDRRLFYMLWLSEADVLAVDAVEPSAGIGPLTPALKAFADFFRIDPALVEAAAERSPSTELLDPAECRRAIAAMRDDEKVAMLMCLYDNDARVSDNLRALVRERCGKAATVTPPPMRTIAELRARSEVIRELPQ